MKIGIGEEKWHIYGKESGRREEVDGGGGERAGGNGGSLGERERERGGGMRLEGVGKADRANQNKAR